MAGGRKSEVLEGTIRQRKDGRWEYRLYMGCDINGKKLYKSLYGKTEREIRERANELEKDKRKYNDKAGNTVFRDYALHWIKVYKFPVLKPVSYDRLEQTYQGVCEYIGWLQMANIDSDNIQKMINDLSKTKAYSTVKKHYEFVNNVFRHAYASGKLERNPCDAVILPIERNMKVKTRKAEILSEEETDRMYALNEQIKKSSNQFLKHLPAILLMLNTGWRVGELLALEWKDIDFKKKEVKISKNLSRYKQRDEEGNVISKTKVTSAETTKTISGERLTPLNETAIELLEQIKAYNKRMKIKSKYVVCTREGGYVSERNLLRTFGSVMGVIDAKSDYTIHSLRHTYASRLLKAGVDISVVSKLLGHSDINTTYGKYIHVIQEQLSSSISLIGKV